jgi:lipoate-protein ligase A
MMQILDTGIQSAEANMSLDARLLENLSQEPILHLYQWARPSATFGYFIRPEHHLKETGKIDLARRPTGGGIVFHIWDLAFSFLLPSSHPAFSLNTLENYEFVNGAVLEVMQKLFRLDEVELITQNGPTLGPDCQHFCMAKPTQYDVVYKGMKIAGAAQRRRKQGFLHQGTISLALPDFDLLREVLLHREEVAEAMGAFTFAPLGNDLKRLHEVRKEIEKLLADNLKERLKS